MVPLHAGAEYSPLSKATAPRTIGYGKKERGARGAHRPPLRLCVYPCSISYPVGQVPRCFRDYDKLNSVTSRNEESVKCCLVQSVNKIFIRHLSDNVLSVCVQMNGEYFIVRNRSSVRLHIVHFCYFSRRLRKFLLSSTRTIFNSRGNLVNQF